jgi:hypothetical protein
VLGVQLNSPEGSVSGVSARARPPSPSPLPLRSVEGDVDGGGG